MKKKEYLAPEVEVVKLQQQMALLAGSDGDGSTADEWGGDGTDVPN